MVAKFELKKSKNDKFVFNLLAANGQVILTSEMYESRASALGGIEAVRKNALHDGRFGRLSAKNGAPYFTLKAGNGQVIGQSQMYSGAKARDAGIESVQTHAAQAGLDDQTAA
ncbi:YegP family protein [Acidovorax sp. D2M1]|uniref:YegP family protein n=1 Tax=Acidovorax benzenivorans TaxID=2987520 RepID=A0ABT5RWE9_9BURK|nr:YegP family protein [Acidovorax benzenivorans]MDD2178020.1 YegP family protein [Acidovorax benzenivorans]